MKIEGYLFIPYQGQIRFRYDDSSQIDARYYASDFNYDEVLGVHALTGKRPPTCQELIYRSSSTREAYTQMIEQALKGWIIAQRHGGRIGHITKMDLGRAEVQVVKNQDLHMYLTVVMVSK